MDVQMPDGTLIQGVPDGMSKADLTAKLQANGYNPAGGSIPQPKEPAPLAPYLVDQFKKGVASIPGLVGQGMMASSPIVKAAAESGALPDIVNPAKFGSRAESALGVQDVSVPPTEYGKPSKANEYLGAMANFAGASVLPGIGVVSSAERKLMAAFVEAAGTTLSATSSVEGKELGKTLATKFGVDPERGGQIGAFLGSLAGPGIVAGAAKGIERGMSATGNFVSDNTGLTGISEQAQKNAARVAASRDLGTALDAAPNSRANLQQAEELQQKIPGFAPTLGQASNAPGVIAIEKRIAGGSPASLATAAQREQDNATALQNFQEGAFPATPTAPTAGAKSKYQQIAGNMETSLDKTNAQIADLAAKNESANLSDVGSQLRALRSKAQFEARQTKNALYQDVYDAADRGGLKAPISDIQAKMTEIAGSDANAAATMPQTFAAVQQAVGKYKAPTPAVLDAQGNARAPAETQVPFEALHSIQKRINADMGAARAAGDYQKVWLTGQLKDVVDAKVAAFEGPQFGDVAQKLTTANKFFATKYQPVFNEGLGGRIGPAAVGKFGETTQDADIVRKLIFNNENPKGIEDFFNIYGNNQEASSLLRNGVLDMFTKAVVRDGEIKPALVESFIRQHNQQLSMLPALRTELKATDAANDLLLARRAAIEDQQKAFSQSIIAKVANTEDPASAVAKALTDERAMRVLANNAARVPNGSQALGRSIADAIMQQKDPVSFLLENASVIKPALDKLGSNHFNNLVTLAGGAQVAGRVKAPQSVELEKLKDIGEATTGTSVKGLFSRLMNVEKGYMSGPYAALDVGGRYIYKIKAAEARRLMEAAIYDPEMARALAKVEKVPPGPGNNILAHTFSHGIRVMSVANENQR